MPIAIENTATETIELPVVVAAMLKLEVQYSKMPIAEYIRQWLEDQADGRKAARRMRLLKMVKPKPFQPQRFIQNWVFNGL